MNIHECQRYAQEHGFDSVKFLLFGNRRVIPCRWLDAYFGMFVVDIEGQDDSFIMARQVEDFMPHHECEIRE